MSQFFSLEYGVGGCCVLLTIMVLMRVAEFVLAGKAKKESAADAQLSANTKAIADLIVELRFLRERMDQLGMLLSEVPKLKMDLRRFYSAIKEIAGDDWPAIRDEIMKDGFHV